VAKTGRKYTVDTHPQRDKIVRAIIQGEASLRVIAGQFGLPRSAVSRYLKDRLAPQAAAVMAREEAGNGAALLDRLEAVMARMQKLYDACDEYLRDPNDPERYDLGPRAWDIDVTYRTAEPGAGRMVTRRKSLDFLLLSLGEKGYEPLEVRFRQADPRRLIIDTAAVLGKHLELLARIRGEAKDQAVTNVTVNQWFIDMQEIIVHCTAEYPEVRAAIISRIKELNEAP
jgi:hypothetical protein